MTKDEKYRELLKKINRWNYEYYVLEQPSVSDREYDSLYKEIQLLEQNHPELVASDSPTQKVGETPQSHFEKVERKEKMFSLENTYNGDEVSDFVSRVQKALPNESLEWIIEPKIDGLSIECVYENGLLILGATRGDGWIGENVTANIKTIRSIPLRLQDQPPKNLLVRGEVYLNREHLELINSQRKKENLPEFKNPRNAASGSLRLLDPKITASRPLRAKFYYLRSDEIQIKRHEEIFDYLKLWGLPTHIKIEKVTSTQELIHACEQWKSYRDSFSYDVDGIVVKLISIEQQNRLGFTAKYPRWAIAYKYEAEQAETQIVDISFQVGRTGALTPVAHLNPIFLSGTTVSRASLHNMDEVRKKDIRVGDHVIVEKAGEIIPQIVSVLTEKRSSQLPLLEAPIVCPACGSKVGKIDEEQAAIRCLNQMGCPAQLKESIRYFCSRKAFNIDKVGPALIDQLVEKKVVKDVSDLFRLNLENILPLERMAKKSAQNIIEAIQKAKNNVTYPRLLTALGIPLLGETASMVVAKKTSSIDFFLKQTPDVWAKELDEMFGIGPKITQSLVQFFSEPRNIRILEQLKELGIHPKMKEIQGPLKGKTFCVTGTLSKARDEIKNDILAAGGEWANRVTQKLHYLVTNEPSRSAKYVEATELGVPVITEEQLYKMIQGAND